jgi:hypothetical protein
VFSDMNMAPVSRRPTAGRTALGRRARRPAAVMVYHPSAG